MLTQEQKIKIAENNKDIPNKEIMEDIFETQKEIYEMEQELKAYEMMEDRMSFMRASYRKSGIKDRKDFIEKLEAILEIRYMRCEHNKVPGLCQYCKK